MENMKHGLHVPYHLTGNQPRTGAGCLICAKSRARSWWYGGEQHRQGLTQSPEFRVRGREEAGGGCRRGTRTEGQGQALGVSLSPATSQLRLWGPR